MDACSYKVGEEEFLFFSANTIRCPGIGVVLRFKGSTTNRKNGFIAKEYKEDL
jgi:hypothetical protein